MTQDPTPGPAGAEDLGPDDLDPDDLDLALGADPVPNPNPSPIATDRQQAAQGGRWGILSGVAEQLGSMAATVVLARLLSPEDFGVVAAATLLLNLLFVLGNVGLGASLIKRRTIDEPVSSTTFWSATALGVALTLALIAAAPLLADLLRQPDITAYVRGLAPLLLLSMVSNVSEARLLRELRFRWVYAADIANIAVYAALTLALAAAGVGAWSMVIGRLVGEAVAAAIRLLSARWRPRLLFDWATVREDLRFNRSYLGMQVSNFASKNLDYWVVSRTLGAQDLGVYYVSFVLPTILRQRMTWLSTEIIMPLMARAADDRERLVLLYRDSLQLLCFVAVPVLVGIALTAEQVIGLAFGPSWSAAVAPLQWLAVAAAIEVTANPATTTFLALDRPQVPGSMLRLRLLLMVAGLAVVARDEPNLEAIAIVVAASTACSAAVPHLAAWRRLEVGPGQLLRWIGPVAVATGAMVVVVRTVEIAVDELALAVQAAAMALAGATAYLLALLAVDGPLARRLLRTGSRLVLRG